MSKLNYANQVLHLTVNSDQEGQRIDNFLISLMKDVPRSHIYKILRRGEVRVNSSRVKPTYKLRSDDVVRVPPLRTQPRAAAIPGPQYIERLRAAIIYENDDIMILDKPWGFAVHGGSGIACSVMDAMRVLRPGKHAPQLAHRLDRDTSGCLLLAKQRQALVAFQEAMKAGLVTKQYAALVKGVWRLKDARLQHRFIKDKRGGEHMQIPHEQGVQAVSVFTTQAVYRQELSLMKVVLETGRTHQIRAQAAAEGHPLVGDSRYGDKDTNRQGKSLGLKRIFLHAVSLEIPGGVFGYAVRVHAPLPEDLAAVLARLQAV